MIMNQTVAQRISIFPLRGLILFPGMQVPLHIFEPRYRSLIGDSMVRDRQIGMIQPRDDNAPPGLYDIGCLGRIVDVEAMDDGRYNVILEGFARFHVQRELDVTTAFRQVEAVLMKEDDDTIALASIERASLEQESRKFAEAQGYSVDWDSVARLDDRSFVNGVAQIAPFDAAAKQALLEANGLSERADLLVQLMQFFGRRDGDDTRVTLQ